MEASVTEPRQRPGAPAPAEEIDFAAAQAEQKAQDEAAGITSDAQKTPEEDLIDLLAPKKGAKEWGFGKDQDDKYVRTYMQRELSVISKGQWFSLVGEVLEKAMSGDNALSLNTILAPPESVRGFTQGQAVSAVDFQDADMFISAIGKMLVHMPDFLGKSICIWLAVPDFEWELAQELMKLSPELGGLADDQFNEMVEIFIDQNFEAIRANFRERWPRLRARYQQRAKEADAQSQSQKR